MHPEQNATECQVLAFQSDIALLSALALSSVLLTAHLAVHDVQACKMYDMLIDNLHLQNCQNSD